MQHYNGNFIEKVLAPNPIKGNYNNNNRKRLGNQKHQMQNINVKSGVKKVTKHCSKHKHNLTYTTAV
jgi:hypothetical protein